MKVQVQFFSQLRAAANTGAYAIADGATVADLLEKLYATYPKLRAWDKSILVGAGVDFVERDHLLREGEEISIMPPVQGG